MLAGVTTVLHGFAVMKAVAAMMIVAGMVVQVTAAAMVLTGR